MDNDVVQGSKTESTPQNNALDTLGANILENLTQTQPSENADAVSVKENAATQEGTETTATQTQAETKPSVEDEGTVTRLEQQLKESQDTLRMIGVDPNGTDAEQLRDGIVTFDQLHPTAAKTETSLPQVPLSQKITNIQNKLSSRQGDVTAENYSEDMKEILGVVTDLVETNKSLSQRSEQSDLKNMQQQNITTVYDELGQTEVFKNLDPSVQETAKQMVLGAVDIGVSRLATQPNVGNQAYTPAGYKHVANQFIPKFNELITKAFEAGKAANTQQIVKNNTAVVPITAGTGANAVQTPVKRFKVEDMAKIRLNIYRQKPHKYRKVNYGRRCNYK